MDTRQTRLEHTSSGRWRTWREAGSTVLPCRRCTRAPRTVSPCMDACRRERTSRRCWLCWTSRRWLWTAVLGTFPLPLPVSRSSSLRWTMRLVPLCTCHPTSLNTVRRRERSARESTTIPPFRRVRSPHPLVLWATAATVTASARMEFYRR